MKATIQNLSELTDSKELLAAKTNPFILYFLYLLLLILLAAGIWMYFGEMEDYVKADGLIRPNDKISAIQNIVAGKVIVVNYDEAKRVKQGDILYEIDHTQWDLEHKNITSELVKKKAELSNLYLLRKSFVDGTNYFNEGPIHKDKQVATIDIKYANKYTNYIYRIRQLETIISQKEEMHRAFKKLYGESAASYKDYIDTRYQLENAQIELQKYKMDALNQIENDITIMDSDLEKLQKSEAQISATIRDAIVKAPIDGVVNVLTEINKGDFISAEARMLTIVPENNTQYKVVLYVSNKDIANIKKGQQIHYDFLALPYKEYGELTGVITKVGTDAKSEASNKGNYYSVEATVENKPVYSHKGIKAELKTGMVCNARIVTGSKKLLYYVLEKINLRE